MYTLASHTSIMRKSQLVSDLDPLHETDSDPGSKEVSQNHGNSHKNHKNETDPQHFKEGPTNRKEKVLNVSISF